MLVLNSNGGRDIVHMKEEWKHTPRLQPFTDKLCSPSQRRPPRTSPSSPLCQRVIETSCTIPLTMHLLPQGIMNWLSDSNFQSISFLKDVPFQQLVSLIVSVIFALTIDLSILSNVISRVLKESYNVQALLAPLPALKTSISLSCSFSHQNVWPQCGCSYTMTFMQPSTMTLAKSKK